MKTLAILGSLLCLLGIAAAAEEVPVPPPAPVIPALPLIQLRVADLNPEQAEENIEICTQNLLAIGKSLQAYHKVNGDFPEWLSDLHHPRYLPDADILLCPSDRRGGKALFPRNVDPKLPTSYGYQLHPEYRARKPSPRLLLGDVVPLVRCRHHATAEFHCLNLNFAFQVTRSFSLWEAYPEHLYESPEAAIRGLEEGLQRYPYHARLACYIYPALARLYLETDRAEGVDPLIARFQSVMDPDYDKNWSALAEMLEMRDRTAEVLQVLKRLESLNPNDRELQQRLAAVHEQLGNTELALEHRKRAEPISAMIGEPIPDFAATDIQGEPISLAAYRGKVVLLNFWAVLAPAEILNVKRVYETYKDRGFEVIGVSLDAEADEKRFRAFLKENGIAWRQIFSGKGWGSPIRQQYDVQAIPTGLLIGRDGTLISTQARGIALEKLVADALKK